MLQQKNMRGGQNRRDEGEEGSLTRATYRVGF